jgi:putative DNA primase/helicase
MPQPERPPAMAVAQAFAEQHPGMRWFRGSWHTFVDGRYRPVEADKVKADVWQFTDPLVDRADRKYVREVTEALAALTMQEQHQHPPCWIDPHPGDPPADELLPVRNGLLHLPTKSLRAPTSRLFVTTSLPFDYVADAPPPSRWLKFLESVWGDDPDQIKLLQEVIGYMLLADISRQKFFLLLGPTRAGKGVITRRMEKLVGEHNRCAPHLHRLGDRFGMIGLVGKTLAVISELDLHRRSQVPDVVNSLLRLTAGDPVDVEFKRRNTYFHGVLPIRIVISSNLLPPLPNISGALAARMVALKLERSFAGQEDSELDHRLDGEMSAILNWAVEGWQRLRDQGEFTEAKAGERVKEIFRELASPLHAFLRDSCSLDDHDAVTPKELLWERFCAFEAERSMPPAYRSASYFHQELIAATSYRLEDCRVRIGGRPTHAWRGIRLKGLQPAEAAVGS